MENEDSVRKVARLVARYVESPSRARIRHPKSIDALAHEIVRAVSGHDPTRPKWTKEREALALKAAMCWIPPEDLHRALNILPGPPLTETDIQQRLKDFVKETVTNEPNPDHRTHCLEIYDREKKQSTEFAAIVGAIADWVNEAYHQLFEKVFEDDQRRKAEARLAKEKVLLSGADCNWTTIGTAKTKWCRIEGRTFRAAPTDQPAPGKGGKKMVVLHRVKTTAQDEPGILIGTYETFTLAAEIARQLITTRDPRTRAVSVRHESGFPEGRERRSLGK